MSASSFGPPFVFCFQLITTPKLGTGCSPTSLLRGAAQGLQEVSPPSPARAVLECSQELPGVPPEQRQPGIALRHFSITLLSELVRSRWFSFPSFPPFSVWLLLEHLMMWSMSDEPSLEPYSCDADDERRFLYCFLTPSMNSSHRATVFGVWSFWTIFSLLIFFLEHTSVWSWHFFHFFNCLFILI